MAKRPAGLYLNPTIRANSVLEVDWCTTRDGPASTTLSLSGDAPALSGLAELLRDASSHPGRALVDVSELPLSKDTMSELIRLGLVVSADDVPTQVGCSHAGRRVGIRMESLPEPHPAAVLDDFLPESGLLPELQANFDKLGAGRYWWDGIRESNPFEQLAGHVAETQLGKDVIGADYWSNVFGPGTEARHPIHTDVDEVTSRLTKGRVLLYPALSAVFYPFHLTVDGGDTRIGDLTVEPRYNRLVLFDGSQEHEILPVFSGIRKSLAINFWTIPPFAFFRSLFEETIAGLSFRTFKSL